MNHRVKPDGDDLSVCDPARRDKNPKSSLHGLTMQSIWKEDDASEHRVKHRVT
jgi:hypothetical protein